MEATVLSTGVKYQNVPQIYARPESERPRLSEVSQCENIPIIDLGCPDQSHVVQQIGAACETYGFFQVINHEVCKEVVDKMLGVAHEFFNLAVEEKMKLYSDDPSKTMRLSTSFNVETEKVHNWRDYLIRLHCYPLHHYTPQWPSNPPSFKEIVSAYCKEVREVGHKLEELISESLGLEREKVKNVLGEPELTFGLPGHTDPNALTILLQDLEVAGLQVRNGRYKSVWHRAVVNSDKPRMSVPMMTLSSVLRESSRRAVQKPYTPIQNTTKSFDKHCLDFFNNLH